MAQKFWKVKDFTMGSAYRETTKRNKEILIQGISKTKRKFYIPERKSSSPTRKKEWNQYQIYAQQHWMEENNKVMFKVLKDLITKMFTVALLVIAKYWKWPDCSYNDTPWSHLKIMLQKNV